MAEKKSHNPPRQDMLPGTKNVFKGASKISGSTDKLKKLIKTQEEQLKKK